MLDSGQALVLVGTLATAMGAVIAKGVDMYVHRKKTDADANSVRMLHVNEANKQLLDGLFQQVKILGDDLARLRAEVAQCEVKHAGAREEVVLLRDELRQLKQAVTR